MVCPTSWEEVAIDGNLRTAILGGSNRVTDQRLRTRESELRIVFLSLRSGGKKAFAAAAVTERFLWCRISAFAGSPGIPFEQRRITLAEAIPSGAAGRRNGGQSEWDQILGLL